MCSDIALASASLVLRPATSAAVFDANERPLTDSAREESYEHMLSFDPERTRGIRVSRIAMHI
jgi:hypothetical protein